MPTAAIAAIVLVVVALVGVLIWALATRGAGGPKAVTTTKKPSVAPSSTSVTSAPSPTVSSTPVSSSTPVTDADRLASLIPATMTCTPTVLATGDFGFGTALAATNCTTPGGPDTIEYLLYPDVPTMNTDFYADATHFGVHAGQGTGCANGPPSESPYEIGSVSNVGRADCYVDGGSAWLGWTMDASDVLGYADRNDGDSAALYDWWKTSITDQFALVS